MILIYCTWHLRCPLCIIDKNENSWKFDAKTLHFLLKWWYFHTCILVSLVEICNSLKCYRDDTIFHMLLIYNLYLLMEFVRGWS